MYIFTYFFQTFKNKWQEFKNVWSVSIWQKMADPKLNAAWLTLDSKHRWCVFYLFYRLATCHWFPPSPWIWKIPSEVPSVYEEQKRTLVRIIETFVESNQKLCEHVAKHLLGEWDFFDHRLAVRTLIQVMYWLSLPTCLCSVEQTWQEMEMGIIPWSLSLLLLM